MRINFMSAMVAMLLSLATVTSSLGEDTPAVPHFAISGFHVVGNTLLPPERVLELLHPFTGPGRDFGTVQEALEAFQEEYRRLGYTTVHVLLPEQELERGEVKLQVVEGKLEAVRVEGNRYFDTENIRRTVPGLKEGAVPNIDAVSASMNVANENPTKKMTLQLQSGAKEDELIAGVRVIDDRPWKVGLSFDNSGSPSTGDFRLGTLFQHANLFNRDHILSLQYTVSTAKPGKVKIYSAGYRIPLYSLGDSIDFFGGYSDVNSGTIASSGMDLQVSGKGTISGIRYNQNLRRMGSWKHRLVYGFDYRVYDNNVDLYGIPLGNKVSVHPISLTYIGSGSTGEGFDWGGYVTGIRNIAGHTESEDFESVRSGAPADYSILRYGFNLGVALPGDWQERLLFNGQYTDNPLVPAEQFGLGGAGSVRGFPEREITSDWGHFASQELYTPDLCRLTSISSSQCRLVGFFDIGHVVRVRPASGDPGDSLIAGGGIGLRLAIRKEFTLSVDYAIVALSAGSREQGDDRLHFRAALLF